MSIDTLIEKAKAKGNERKYLDWLSRWPSALSDTYGSYIDGEGRNDPAHVRRVSKGAGIAEKPEFFAIPLTHEEHFKTHQHGEEIFNPASWYERKAIEYLCHYVNGLEPPEDLKSKQWKKVIDIESANHMNAIKLRAIEYFKTQQKYPLRITIEPHYKKRSSNQNRSQWGVIYSQVYEFFQENPKALAELIIKIVYSEYNYSLLHELFKHAFNEGKSTITSTEQSCDYMNTIISYFKDNYDYDINEPESPTNYY